MKRISVHVDDFVFENIKKEAANRGTSVSRVAADNLMLRYGRRRGRPLKKKEPAKSPKKK